MPDDRRAPVDHEVLPAIAERWSPYAFDPKPVESALLDRCFEAARWASSSFNEQPWRFVVGDKHADADGHARVLAVLIEANQGWAQHAPVLILGAARTTFTRNDRDNRAHAYDTGQAAGLLTVQAASMGLATHQMAGFDVEKARADCGIPAPFEPMFVIALGYPGDGSLLPDDVKARDGGERKRNPQSDFVFPGGRWPAGG